MADRGFGIGFARSFLQSMEEARRKHDEAEQAKQEFLQRLQLELLQQIPEIEKNVFAGEADPAAAAASLEQFQRSATAVAPAVPAGNFVDSLVGGLLGAPDTSVAPVDLSGLGGRLAQVQATGERRRLQDQAAKTQREIEKEKRTGNTAEQLLERARVAAGLDLNKALAQAQFADQLARKREEEREARLKPLADSPQLFTRFNDAAKTSFGINSIFSMIDDPETAPGRVATLTGAYPIVSSLTSAGATRLNQQIADVNNFITHQLYAGSLTATEATRARAQMPTASEYFANPDNFKAKLKSAQDIIDGALARELRGLSQRYQIDPATVPPSVLEKLTSPSAPSGGTIEEQIKAQLPPGAKIKSLRKVK